VRDRQGPSPFFLGGASVAENRTITMRLSANRAIPDHFCQMAGRKDQEIPPTALKTLTDYSGFYNAYNEINVPNQTTNLGVRSSNLFGRANSTSTIGRRTAPTSAFCRSDPSTASIARTTQRKIVARFGASFPARAHERPSQERSGCRDRAFISRVPFRLA
jgi:hypothetical protein